MTLRWKTHVTLLLALVSGEDIYSLSVSPYNIFSSDYGNCHGSEVDYCTLYPDGDLKSIENYYYFIYRGDCRTAISSDDDGSDNIILTIFDSDGHCVTQNTLYNPYKSAVTSNKIGDQIDVNIVLNEKDNQLLVSWIFVDIQDSIYYMILDTNICTEPNQRKTAAKLSNYYENDDIDSPKGCLLSNSQYIVVWVYSNTVYYDLISTSSYNAVNSEDDILISLGEDPLIAAHYDSFLVTYKKRMHSITSSYVSQIYGKIFHTDIETDGVKINEFIIAGDDINGEYQNIYLQYVSSIDVYFVLYQYVYDADVRYLHGQLINPYSGNLILSSPIQIYSAIIDHFCIDQVTATNEWVSLFFGFSDFTYYAQSIILNITSDNIEIAESLTNIAYSQSSLIKNMVCSTMKNELFIIYGAGQFSKGLLYENQFNDTYKESTICIDKASFIFLYLNVCVSTVVMLNAH